MWDCGDYVIIKLSLLSLRLGCGSGDVSAVVHDTGAELQVGSSPDDMTVNLVRLEGSKATEELKELLFRMADSLNQIDSKYTFFVTNCSCFT